MINESGDGIALVDEIRALSNAGLHYTDDPYQIERYHRIIELSAALIEVLTNSTQESVSADELTSAFFADLRYMTPYSVVDTAVFDAAGRLLLIQRQDNGLWALPGGACEVGEPAATGAAREVWEETGCVCQVSHFIGLFDNRLHGGQSIHHLYSLLFAGTKIGGEIQRTRETRDVGWFDSESVPWKEMVPVHRSRVEHAFRWLDDPTTPTFFDPVDWTPEPTWQHELD